MHPSPNSPFNPPSATLSSAPLSSAPLSSALFTASQGVTESKYDVHDIIHNSLMNLEW